MPNPKNISLISPHPSSLKALPERFFSYDLVTYAPEQIQWLDPSASVFLLHLNGNIADGPQLIRTLKRHSPRTPIIVLAEKPTPEEVIEAYDCGASDFVILPLDLVKLRSKLQYHLRKVNPFRLWRERLRAWLTGRRSLVPSLAEPVETPVTTFDLDIRFFGPFEVSVNGRGSLQLRGKRVLQLLACLIFHYPDGTTPDRLMDNLWPDIPYESARNSLNVALSQLRSMLSDKLAIEEGVVLKQGKYALNPSITLRTDLDRFNQLRSQGRQYGKLGEKDREAECYRKALDIYRGDFLEDLAQLEWTAGIRDTLWENRLLMLERLGQYYFDLQSYDQAIHIFKQLLEQDPCLEKVHRQLMLAYWNMGERGRALQQFAKCEKVLQEELNAAPSSLTRDIYNKIRSF